MKRFNDERGATAVLVAGAMIFLFGAAALAVDTSIFYGDALGNQKTADLSCLAGVIEDSDDDKVTMAANFTVQNWPQMQGGVLNVGAGSLTSGDHQVTYETNVDGDPNKMRVRVLKSADTNFARAIGTNTVTVVQEATCVATAGVAFTGLPFGIDVGGFDGWLQKENPCKGGTCHPLDIPRDDTNATKEKLVRNATFGPDRDLSWHHGDEINPGSPSGMRATWCTGVSAGDECHLLQTDQGVSASHLADAMKGRLQQNSASQCVNWRGSLDCTSLVQALGGNPQVVSTLGSAPPGWDADIYGPYGNAVNHVYYNPAEDDPAINCEAPRWGQAPVVAHNLDWDRPDPYVDYSGKSDLKIIQFATVYITAPTNTNDTFQANGNQLKNVAAVIVWFGEHAKCSNGAKLPPPGMDAPSSVKLISG